MKQALLPLLFFWAPAALAQDSTPASPQATPAWLESLQGVATQEAFAIGAQVGLALLLLFIGWVLARIAASLVFRALKRTTWDDWLAEKLGLNVLLEGRDGEDQIERFFANFTYYVLLALVIVGALQTVGLTQVASPIQSVVDSFAQALPMVFKAALILVIAWTGGTILRIVITRALDGAGIDERFSELSQVEPESDANNEQASEPLPSFSENVGNVVFWLSMLVGLAGAFEALQIGPLADPMRNAMDELIGILPNLGVAALLVFVGFVIGRIARAAVTNVLRGVGFDSLVDQARLTPLFGGYTPSHVAGTLAMAFILLQASIAALDRLQLQTLSSPLENMMARFWLLLPDLAIAGLIIVAGITIGRIVREVVTSTLKGWGFDDVLERLGLGSFANHSEDLDEPSEIAGLVAQVAIILVAVAQTLDHLQLDTWESYVNSLLAYSIQNVLVSIVIVGLGFALGNYVEKLVASREGEGETNAWLGALSRYAILVFTFTMALRHLNVAEDFVLMSFGLLFGALCLAVALAFGLGSREVAADIVRRQYDKVQDKQQDKPE